MSAMSASLDPFDVERSCSGKVQYPSEDAAKATAVACWQKRRVWLRAYVCDVCSTWHLTKKDAAPMMREGWRPPRISERQQNIQRKRNKRRRAG